MNKLCQSDPGECMLSMSEAGFGFVVCCSIVLNNYFKKLLVTDLTLFAFTDDSLNMTIRDFMNSAKNVQCTY